MDHRIFNVRTFWCLRVHTGVGHTDNESAHHFDSEKLSQIFLVLWFLGIHNCHAKYWLSLHPWIKFALIWPSWSPWYNRHVWLGVKNQLSIYLWPSWLTGNWALKIKYLSLLDKMDLLSTHTEAPPALRLHFNECFVSNSHDCCCCVRYILLGLIVIWLV